MEENKIEENGRTVKQNEAIANNRKRGQTPESNKKRSEAAKGHIVNPLTREKISKSKKGKKVSEETKLKMKLGQLRRRENEKAKKENQGEVGS